MDPIDVICKDCGNKFQTTYWTFKSRKKDHHWRCRACLNTLISNTQKNLPREKQLERTQRMQEGKKDWLRNRSEEEKLRVNKKISDSLKRYLNGLSNEKISSRISPMKDGYTIWYNNLSEEKRSDLNLLLQDGRMNWFTNSSVEEKLNAKRKKSSSLISYWAGLSDEEKTKRLQLLKKNGNWYNNLSEEDKIEFSKKQSILTKKYWDSLSEEVRMEKISFAKKAFYEWYNRLSREEKMIRNNNISILNKEYYNSLSEEDKYLHVKNMLESQSNIGPSEYQFQSLLNWNGFIEEIHYKCGYHTVNWDNGRGYENPEFYHVFGKVNPFTHGENYPWKEWDFIIYSKNSKNILIDIDGSIHVTDFMRSYSNGKTFSNLANVQFYESQRSYQIPPDCHAYVIYCYDDDLKDETPVYSFQTDEIMSLEAFMAIARLIVFPEDYRAKK